VTAVDWDRIRLALHLERSINNMAGRYGIACMDQANARLGTDEHAAANRKASRQYRALMRLTCALSELVGGTQ
jgi:hypothetical protein